MIHYDPKKLLKKIAPQSKIERLLKGNVSLKKTALSFVDSVDFLDRKKVTEVALNVVDSYQKRIAKAQAETGERSAGTEIKNEILDDPKLLIQRVQNEVIWQVKEEIKKSYSGEPYEWLPSSANEADPEHALNYGKIFIVGEGEMPGDRDGCQCGMNILVKETQLDLG